MFWDGRRRSALTFCRTYERGAANAIQTASGAATVDSVARFKGLERAVIIRWALDGLGEFDIRQNEDGRPLNHTDDADAPEPRNQGAQRGRPSTLRRFDRQNEEAGLTADVGA